MDSIWTYLILGTGGFAGTMLRYATGAYLSNRFQGDYPFGTLIVNLLGSFVIGFLVVLTTRQVLAHPGFRLFFIVGFLGGFTTYSSFSLESFKMIQSGHTGRALVYMGITLSTGLMMTAAGYFLANRLVEMGGRT